MMLFHSGWVFVLLLTISNYQSLGIQMLEIADGLKDAIIHAAFTVESILCTEPEETASTIGIDLYVAKIIIN
jgi:hypothetical protein